MLIVAATLTVLLVACSPDDGPRATLSGQALAGPTCPVVTDPPDPACADHPVAGAVVIITDLDGREVARATTDEEGQFSVLLLPGAYVIVPQPVDGLMGTAGPMNITLVADGDAERVVIAYDTGIR